MKPPTLKYEKGLWRRGYRLVCGLDEVGRGAWAGPLVAAAVIFPQDLKLQRSAARTLRIRDSKQLQPRHRETLDLWIRKNCLAYAIAEVGVPTINREGIGQATQRAFRKCLRAISPQADFTLIDAFYIRNLPKKKQLPIIKGDQKSISIAAASIVAKVHRDNLMRRLHQKDKRYRFDQHKGYGTKLHQKALQKHGPSLHHRRDFIPD